MTERTALQRLQGFGQSVWLCDIERGFVRSGGLAQMIADDGVSGVTFNPEVFGEAIARDEA